MSLMYDFNENKAVNILEKYVRKAILKEKVKYVTNKLEKYIKNY